MNILFIETSLDPNKGGIERVSYTNAITLEKKGCSCFFAYFNRDYSEIPDDKKIKISSLDQNSLNQTLASFIIKNKIGYIINQDIYSKTMRNFYSVYKEDLGFKLINCFHLSPNFYEYQKMTTLKAKLKYLTYQFVYGMNWFVRERRLMYDICDKFVLLSESFINDFARLYKLKDSSKLIAIPNPLPFHDDSIVDLSMKQKVVLIISRLYETQKNIKASLRIWKEVQRRGFHDWKLEIVGKGQDEDILKKYAKEIELTNYEFMGESSNVEEYYKKASVFMMTSNYEGFGMTILEAQHFGCIPIVMDNFSVAHDLINNEENGYLVLNENAFVEIMADIFMSSKNLLPLYNNCINSSVKFKSESVCKKWASLFEQL